ncbi:LD-carboxypeptidase, partial [Listeria monocytogenes]|nr:LD-carboxypeptidase [Listeria monocytogenes]
MADIKLNYGVLEDISSELYRYMRALEEMKSALEQISQIIGSQTGQAIEAVQARKELLTEHTSTYKI